MNIVISNNRITDVGTGVRMLLPESYAPGAISSIVRPEPGLSGAASGNRNLVIENNQIDGCPGAGIFLHALDGAIVRNNRIGNVLNRDCSRAGRDFGFRIDRPIVTTPSAVNVKLENNREH
jgi:parallel beta-helix repeat protein